MGNDIFDAIAGAPGTWFNPVTGAWGVDLNSPAFSPFAYEFTGTLYGKQYDQKFDTIDAYANWLADIAALPESQTYMAFAAMCQNQGCDPNAAYAAQSQYSAGVYGVILEGHQVDEGNLGGWWKDPLTYLHNGDASWYEGYFLDTPHMVASDRNRGDMSAHIDPCGPFDPLHYLIQMPEMLLPSGPRLNGTCAVVGGCALR